MKRTYRRDPQSNAIFVNYPITSHSWSPYLSFSSLLKRERERERERERNWVSESLHETLFSPSIGCATNYIDPLEQTECKHEHFLCFTICNFVAAIDNRRDVGVSCEDIDNIHITMLFACKVNRMGRRHRQAINLAAPIFSRCKSRYIKKV